MYGSDGVEPRAVAALSSDEQSEAMEEWFRSRFESPNERMPCDDGEFVWIWGGPFDARTELLDRYEGYVPDEVIDDLARRLEDENFEWAPVESIDDYDPDLIAAIRSTLGAQVAFMQAFDDIRSLLDDARGSAHEDTHCKLLYSYVLTTLECYLCDTFAREVLESAKNLESFVSTTPEFQERKIRFSEVFVAADSAGEEAAKYLGDVVWHNLSKVSSMYRDTLDVHFGDHLGPLMKRISVRHDIVHRNGHDKDGKAIRVVPEDVEDFAVRAQHLVAHIEAQLPPSGLEIS